ncbi:MAG: hypothetical protein FWD17_13365 [Polyangiaceae bacterium]|nr:hypothetical protein [Polyangiaceae bacterium]
MHRAKSRTQALGRLGFAAALLLAGGCHATQAAAARDPVSCERDPNCARYKGSYSDCTKQCADNPECVDRCRQAQSDPGLGH